MKFSNALHMIGGSIAKSKVLAVLAAYPQKEWSGLALSKAAKTSQPQAWKALRELSNEGVVLSKKAGNATMWSFNPKHALAKPIAQLADPLQLLVEEIRRHVEKQPAGKKIRKLFLFGSVARGEERHDSDIDIFAQVDDGKDKDEVLQALISAAQEITEEFGNPAIPIVLASKEMQKEGNKKLVNAVFSEGKMIFIR